MNGLWKSKDPVRQFLGGDREDFLEEVACERIPETSVVEEDNAGHKRLVKVQDSLRL